MENNNNWYESNPSVNNNGQTPASNQPQGGYQGAPYYTPGYTQAAYPNNAQTRGGSKKRFGWSQLIVCMLVVALLAGAAGAGIWKLVSSNNTPSDGGQSAYAQSTPQATASSPGMVIDDSAIPAQSDQQSHSDASKGITLGSQWTSEDTVNDMLKSCMSSVVGIDILSNVSSSNYYWYGGNTDGTNSQQPAGSGSGVIITPDGYIVTCNHVISGADTILVYLQDGTQYEATLVGADSMTDLAVIKIDASDLPVAPVGNSAESTVGDTVYAIGNPLGALISSVSDGIVSGLDRLVTVEDIDMTLMQTDAAVNPGNSGGALFNSKGELIGIVNAKATGTDVEGIGFAIPIDSALPVVSDLMDLGYVSGRPYLGITPQDVYLTSGPRNVFGYSSYTTRVQVNSVESGSCADKAGMMAGDVIMTFDGKDVYGSAELSAVLYEYSIGDTVKIMVLRNNEQLELTLTLGERSSAK